MVISVDVAGCFQRCNVTIDRGTATLTIQNDDPVPGISINDVTLAETNSGPRSFNFFVTLSNRSSKQISVQFATADGSALAGSDYGAISGTLTFTPDGSTTRVVTVLVNGDPVVEGDENFFVNLTNPTEATLVDAQGVGTIQNEDLPPVLLLEENTQRAAALEVTTLLRDLSTRARVQLRPRPPHPDLAVCLEPDADRRRGCIGCDGER